MNEAARADLDKHKRCYFRYLNYLDYVEFEMCFKDPEPEEENMPIESDIPPSKQLGIVCAEKWLLQDATSMLLRRIIRTSAALNELISSTSDSHAMLHKTGLIDFAHQFARKLDYLRDNAHRQIAMRAFASVDLLPLQRGRLQVRINNKLRPVEMKNHSCQKKSA